PRLDGESEEGALQRAPRARGRARARLRLGLRRARGGVGVVRAPVRGAAPAPAPLERRLAHERAGLRPRGPGGLRDQRVLVAAAQEVARARTPPGALVRAGHRGGDGGHRGASAQARPRGRAQAAFLRSGAEEVMSAPRVDAIVIGGGHNGLVAAAYLARAGRRTLVLERRPLVGGAAV